MGRQDAGKKQEILPDKGRIDGLFTNPKRILEQFDIAGDRAERIVGAINNGEWLKLVGTRQVFEPDRQSESRLNSGTEVLGYKGTRSVDIQFSFMEMINEVTKELGQEDDAEKVKKGIEKFTKYSDIELSLSIPISDGEINDNLLVDKFKNKRRLGVEPGGWTSNIDYARKHNAGKNSPMDEADLIQRYFSRHRGKDVVCASNNGPAMGEVLKDGVNSFSPEDYSLTLGITTAFFQGGGETPIDFEGHSMAGAAGQKALEENSFPEGSTAILLNPAIAGTNIWAGEKPIVSRRGVEPEIMTKSREAMGLFIREVVEKIDKIKAKGAIEPIQKEVSFGLTQLLFLMGDRDKLALLYSHVRQLMKYPNASAACARGCRSDNPEADFNKMADKPWAVVTSVGDQMVDAASTLAQMPENVPMFTPSSNENKSLDERIKDGSHYEFKRNGKGLVFAEIQKAQEVLGVSGLNFLKHCFYELRNELRGEKRVEDILIEKSGELFGGDSEVVGYLENRKKLNSYHSADKMLGEYFIALGLTDVNASQLLGKSRFEVKKLYNPEYAKEFAKCVGNENMDRVEILIQNLDVLRYSVHFNESGDELFQNREN